MDDIRPPDDIPNGTPPDETPHGADDADRLGELERELAKAKAERDEFKDATYALLEQLFPYEPVTEADLHDMLHGPRGQPIIEVIEEYERSLKAAGNE